MTKDTVGREPILIVEIVQPSCGNVFGSSPCTASGAADAKCYNTFTTCQDTPNYTASTLSLFFSRGNVADQEVSGATYIIPSLVSVSTLPTRINLSSADSNASGLGNRAVCTIRFKDHPHTDRIVDPYIDGRSWDAYQRGSFWVKWLARNKYRQNITLKIYEGYAGQALSAMNVREYIWTGLSGPDSQGNISITGKDILSKIEERKAKAPLASPGELFAGITNSASSFEATGATESDYAASGTLRIGREVMTYASRANSTNGVTFSTVARGTDGTTAATGSAGDAVQACLRYTDARVDDVLEDLLETYGGIPSAKLDTTNWATEVDNYAPSLLLNRLITEPTGVDQLASEVQEQASVYIWWDERDALVKLRVISGVDVEPDTLTEAANILDGSLSIADLPKYRTSQVWVYYEIDNPAESLDDTENWKSLAISADLSSEGANEYGEKSVRTIFAGWIPSSALAPALANKLLVRYVDVPREAKFRLDAKDRAYWTGDTVRLSTDLDMNAFGVRVLSLWTIVSAEEIVPGEVVEYVAQDTTLYGKIFKILAAGAADYDPTTATFSGAYIGNASGLLSDGTNSARIT
jgi:hypothetical protein